MPANQYLESWEDYWGEDGQEVGPILWDVTPDQAALRDVPRIQRFLDSKLPLIDVGCGNGTQTAFLAQHVGDVIGTDISPAAVALADKAFSAPNVSFRVLDILDAPMVRALHDELGDANVYIRGVIHQLDPADQPVAARAIGELMGSHGRCYLIELASHAEAYFESLIAEVNEIPEGLVRVFRHGIEPGRFKDDALDQLFPPETFSVLESGVDEITLTYQLPDGGSAGVPAFYAVVARNAGVEAP